MTNLAAQQREKCWLSKINTHILWNCLKDGRPHDIGSEPDHLSLPPVLSSDITTLLWIVRMNVDRAVEKSLLLICYSGSAPPPFLSEYELFLDGYLGMLNMENTTWFLMPFFMFIICRLG